MAPSCQGDESIEQHVDKLLQTRTDVEIGLLIGRQGTRDTILLLLPTPQQDGAAPAVLQAAQENSSKKQKKAQPDMQVQLSMDTIVEHAVQVAAMLPGGLSAMGLYLYGPETAFANAASQLCKVLDGITSGSGAAPDKLLFISSQPRKFLCKHRPAGTSSSAALPVCEFKLAPSLAGFSIMTCRYHVSMTLPVLDSMQALSTHVEAAMTAESRRIHDSIGHVQGNLASNPATVNDLQQPLEVELMCAPACVDTAEAADSKGASVTGRVVLEGVLHGRAMVNKKDSVAAAVEMLKADLVASLHARLDILMGEAEELAGSRNGDNTKPALLAPTSQAAADLTLTLPTRVLFQIQDKLSFCDYLATGESEPEANARLQALLGVGAGQIEVLEGKGQAMQGTHAMGKWNPCPVIHKPQSWMQFCNSTRVAIMTSTVAVVAVAAAFYPK